MPLFNASTLTILQAKTRIASVTGADAYADQLIRAGYALEEAWRFWENSRDWRYLMTDTSNGDPIVGTISGGVTFTPTTAADIRKISQGMLVTGSGILTPGTTVVLVDIPGGTVTLSHTASAGSQTFTFGNIAIVPGTSEYGLPTQVKKPYTARLIQNNPRTLLYTDQRLQDYVDVAQTSSGVPIWYKLYNLHDIGKIVLYPDNTVNDTLMVKYYRRHYIPEALQSGSTSADSVVVDFPAQYQTALLAAARVIYMADKGGGPTERLQYWMQTAEQMKRQAIAEDEFLPDADQGFIAGFAAYSAPFTGPNDMRPWLDY